jgi:hypothetical protein
LEGVDNMGIITLVLKLFLLGYVGFGIVHLLPEAAISVYPLEEIEVLGIQVLFGVVYFLLIGSWMKPKSKISGMSKEEIVKISNELAGIVKKLPTKYDFDEMTDMKEMVGHANELRTEVIEAKAYVDEHYDGKPDDDEGKKKKKKKKKTESEEE